MDKNGHNIQIDKNVKKNEKKINFFVSIIFVKNFVQKVGYHKIKKCVFFVKFSGYSMRVFLDFENRNFMKFYVAKFLSKKCRYIFDQKFINFLKIFRK